MNPSDTNLSAPNVEWLVTNGLGGYATGTASGRLTRRYHSLLVAAPRSKAGRFVALNALDVCIEDQDQVARSLGEYTFGHAVQTIAPVKFFLNEGLPEWLYQWEGFKIQKRLLLNHDQNTVLVRYRVVSAPAESKLILRPGINFRRHDDEVNVPLEERYSIRWTGRAAKFPPASAILFFECSAITLRNSSPVPRTLT